jgi:hypothetical protein
MVRHPQNGPTFTKAPPNKRRMTDAERAAWQARNDAEMEETKRTAARSRHLHQLLHKDRKGFLRELGLLNKNPFMKPADDDTLKRWPASKRVNSSRAADDDPTLIDIESTR